MMSLLSPNDYADFWRNDKGVNVIPANGVAKETWIKWTKDPRGNWQEVAIPQEIHDEWKRQNAFKYGMAVICGHVFHNKEHLGEWLNGIDCDNRLAIDEWTLNRPIRELAGITLVEQHKNEKKAHIYYYSKKPMKSKPSDVSTHGKKIDDNIVPGIEIKSEGKNIMYCTPSPHKDGNKYEIIGTPEIKLLDVDSLEIRIDDICKKYGLSYLTKKGEIEKSHASEIIEKIIKKEYSKSEGSNRQYDLISYLTKKKNDNPEFNEDELFLIAKIYQNKYFTEQYDDDVLRQKVKSSIDYGEKNILEKQTKNTEKSKGKISDYADEILEKYHFVTIKDNETLLVYDDGIYTEKNAQYTIKEEVEKMVPDCDRNTVNEVIATVKRRTGKERDEFDSDNDILNCTNGLYNIKTKEFKIHSHTFFSRSKLSVKYNEEAISEHFVDFLKSCHSNNEDEITNLLEEFASCLFFDIDLQKFFMHVGFGSNGKSVYFKVIEALLGKENISNVSIHDLQNNRFASARLDGKRANLHADIENDELNHLGKFKQLVSRDSIHVEEKGKTGYDMTNKAQLFFSANQLPIIQENNNAVYRRPRITEWKVTFADNPKENEKQKDPSLILKLTTENELSGILNLLLPYVLNLKEKRKLSFDQSSDEVKKAWHEKSNPVQLFINEKIIESADAVIGTAKLYVDYSQWTRINNLRTMSKFEFNKEFEQLVSVEKTKGRYLGTSTTIWKGISLREKIKEETKKLEVFG